MPKATASQETERFDLVSCEGGFVELRRLTYGELLQQQDLSNKIDAPVGNDGRPTSVTMSISQEQVQAYTFSKSIISHNLEDENGNSLNSLNEEFPWPKLSMANDTPA